MGWEGKDMDGAGRSGMERGVAGWNGMQRDETGGLAWISRERDGAGWSGMEGVTLRTLLVDVGLAQSGWS